MRIGQNRCALRHQRLDFGSLGHRPFSILKKCFDVRQHARILLQLAPKQLRYQVTRQVIRSRPQTTRRNNKISPRQRFLHSLLDVLSRVRHRHLTTDNQPEIGQTRAQPLLVSI